MKKLLETFTIAVLTGMFAFSACSTPIHNYRRTTYVETSSLNARKYYESVLVVEVQPGTEGHNTSLATAFVIDADHLMTAGHFCEDVDDFSKINKGSKNIEVTAADYKGMKYITGEATVLAYINKGHADMCILEMKDHKMEPLEITKFIDIVETADPVTMVGAPGGQYPIRRDGYVWAITPTYVLVAIEAQGGSSGSPVMWDGEVIGMLVEKAGGVQSAALAIKADDLRAFIEKHIDSNEE